MNNPYIETDENKIISFNLCKVNKGKEKLCKCKIPHYEIDTINRIVMCEDCGAVIDAFDCLSTLTEKMDLYADYQQKAYDKAILYNEMANDALRRRFKNEIFKEMDSSYKQGLLPICPKCHEVIEPTEITGWSRK